jgi:hypothetical protein
MSKPDTSDPKARRPARRAGRQVSTRPNESDASGAQSDGDHPLFGCMAGMVTILSGTDLTAPIPSDAGMDQIAYSRTCTSRGKQR